MVYKVKNVSAEDLLEPWTKVLIKAGETVELEQLQAQRVISVFPYRAKLVVEDVKARGKAAKQEPKPEPPVPEDPLVPKTYQVKNVSGEDVTLAKGGAGFAAGRTVKAGETSEPMTQMEAQMFSSYFQGKVELVVKAAETKDEK